MAAADTAKLIASLSLDARGFNAGVKSANRSIGALEGTVGNIGKRAQQGIGTLGRNVALIGVGAAAAIGAAVKTGLDDLSKLESAITSVDGAISQMGLTGQVTGKQVADWANQIESDIGAAFDDKDITTAATTLIRFGKVTGKNLKPALVVMTDLATKTGDVESAASLLAKALADPTKAAGKLARAGVVLTKAQQKTIEKMVKAKDIAGAQAVILDALSKATKGAAAASQGPYQRALSTLNDVAEDARKALAEGFLPVIQKVADRLGKAMGDPKFINGLRDFGKTLAGGLDSLIDIAVKLPWSTIGNSLKIAGAGAKAVLDAFTSLPDWVQTAVITGWGLNKLTGGALGGIVSELGKGLIKGILGINAATVGIKAGVVTVSGPGVPGGGTAPTPGGAAEGGVRGFLSDVTKLLIVPAAILAVGGAAQAAANEAVGKGLFGLKPNQMPSANPLAPTSPILKLPPATQILWFQIGDNTKETARQQAAAAEELRSLKVAADRTKDDTVAAIHASAANAAADRAHNTGAVVAATKASNQQTAFAVRDAAQGTKGVISATSAAAASVIRGAVNATTSAAHAAGQQTAAAIRDKDLSVTIPVTVPVSLHVSVRDQIIASAKFRQYQKYGGGAR